MGLRFRKSVTLCKGLKLNLGKNGMSVSVGRNGLRKTFHTSGRVTTTVGIPGTGIYYTDTQNLKSKKSSRNRQNPYDGNSLYEIPFTENYDDGVNNSSIYYDGSNEVVNTSEELIDWEDENINLAVNVLNKTNDASLSETKNDKHYFTEGDIEQIYKKCDPTVEWTEIMAGTSAEELLISEESWNYYRKCADKILGGDIDSYLQVIEDIRPLDDLLLYAGDFEYGTDNCNYIEIEFEARPDDVLHKGTNDCLFEKLIKSISLRVARDIMALLPVSKVIVHVVVDYKTILSVDFNKSVLAQIKIWNEKIEDVFDKLKYNIKVEDGEYKAVPRIRFDTNE